jgi:hypothetical protein
MKTKRKAATPKEKWLAVRRRYTWFLRPPFKDKFDHWHWWKGQNKIDPAAAPCELARRHPLVRETWLKNFVAATRSRRGVPAWISQSSESWIEKSLGIRLGKPAYPTRFIGRVSLA